MIPELSREIVRSKKVTFEVEDSEVNFMVG